MSPSRIIPILIGLTMIVLGAGLAFAWGFCRVYVPADKCLVLIRKTGTDLAPGQIIAEEGQKGIQRQALGPGRYFFNPWIWDTEIHDLIDIPAGNPQTWREVIAAGETNYQVPTIAGEWPQVGIVTSLAGKPWNQESEVVDEGFQGIQRRVLTPGTYRLNPLAYKVELANAIIVPLGCCGVVTSQLGEMPGVEIVTEPVIGPDGQLVQKEQRQVQRLADVGQRGVLKNILQPGIYYINPKSSRSAWSRSATTRSLK